MTEVAKASAPRALAAARAWWPGWRDASCVALLYAATVHLAGHDGGRSLASLLPVLALSALVMLATTRELLQASNAVRWIALAWVAGPLVALAFAQVRAGWVLPVATAALALPVFLATLQLLRSPPGRIAVLFLCALGASRAWYWAGLVWYGGGSNHQGEPAWMALAWHNQSGALMGAMGVGALGVALVRKAGPARAVAILLSAAGLSGAWLSGSRGAVLMTLVAVGVVLVAGLRRRPARAVFVTAAASAAFTIGGIAGLSATYAGVGLRDQPVLSRSADAGLNAGARFAYWRGAAGMVAQAPLTGTGPGSYRWSVIPHFPDDTGLTASAHNEPLEALGERGFLGGGGVLLVMLGLSLLVLRTVRRPGSLDSEVAAAGVATLLLGHAVIDFDWNYPILLALLAIAGAVLVASSGCAEREDGGSTRTLGFRRLRALDAAILSITLLLLAAAGAGVRMETGGGVPPWELNQRLHQVVDGAEAGDREAVSAHVAMLRRWNPGAPRLDAVESLVRHHMGELGSRELADRVEAGRTDAADQIRIAARLIEVGHAELARGVLEDLRPVLAGRATSRRRIAAMDVASLTMEAAFREGGCAAAEALWSETSEWAAALGVDALVARLRNRRGGSLPSWIECGFGGESVVD